MLKWIIIIWLIIISIVTLVLSHTQNNQEQILWVLLQEINDLKFNKEK